MLALCLTISFFSCMHRNPDEDGTVRKREFGKDLTSHKRVDSNKQSSDTDNISSF